MKSKILLFGFVFFLAFSFYSCESELEKQERLAKIERVRIENEKQRAEEERLRKLKEEEDARVRAIQEEKERKEKEIYNRYINNSLRTGATPYAYCYGSNSSCDDYGCSEIKVKTPSNSDVMVTIKKNGRVYRHAYIKAGSRYTFEFPNGTYQAFFYYGKGWNPNKFMKEASCGTIRGGFVSDEHVSKDSPQQLNNSILTYELILQQNGNFSTRPSSVSEAF